MSNLTRPGLGKRENSRITQEFEVCWAIQIPLAAKPVHREWIRG